MIGFNHTLIGAIVAVTTPAPLVPVVALVSHFVADAMPHFGRHPKITVDEQGRYSPAFKKLLVVDAVVCFAVLFFAWWLFPQQWFVITVGAFFATLPDFMWLLKGRVAWLDGFFRFASWIQWGERPWGWVLELAYCGIFAAVLVWLQGV